VPDSSRDEVFGVAFLTAEGIGAYSDVFYDSLRNLARTELRNPVEGERDSGVKPYTIPL
jgi:hypothetical protein